MGQPSTTPHTCTHPPTHAHSLTPTHTPLPHSHSLAPAAGKFIGFLLRSIFLVNHDLNLLAASTVFITAGMSACSSGVAGVLGDWCAELVCVRVGGWVG